MGSQYSLTRGSKMSEVESGIEQDQSMCMYRPDVPVPVPVRDHSSRGRRNQNSSRPQSFGDSFGGNSKIIYNETLKGCSLKIYYMELKKKTVVLLDCGEKVFANGKQMYPFDERKIGQCHEGGSRSSCDSADDDFKVESIVCSSVDTQSSTKSERLTLDTIMSQVTDTFQRAMKEEQQYTRKLEEENNTLCWNALEFEQTKCKLEEAEDEKRQLEDELLKMSGKLNFVTSELFKLKDLITNRGKGLIEFNGDVLNIESGRRRRRKKVTKIEAALKLHEGSSIEVGLIEETRKSHATEQSENAAKYDTVRPTITETTSTHVCTTVVSHVGLCTTNIELLKGVYLSSVIAEIVLKLFLILVAKSIIGCICMLSSMFKHK